MTKQQKNNKITLNIAQASLNQSAMNWARNLSNIYSAIDKAVKAGADILALEELTLTGYDCGDDFQRSDNQLIYGFLKDVARYAAHLDPNLIVSMGHPWRLQRRDLVGSLELHKHSALDDHGAYSEYAQSPLYDRLNRPFNVQSIISQGAVQGMSAKCVLFNHARGYEGRYFNQWSFALAEKLGGRYGTIEIDLPQTSDAQNQTVSIPFGRPIYRFEGAGGASFHITHVLCEEKWVASQYDDAGFFHKHESHAWQETYEQLNIIPSIPRYLGEKDGLVIVMPNASPPSRDKMDQHIHLAALASNYADLIVDTDGLGASGSSFAQFGHKLTAQNGEILMRGARSSFSRVDMMFSVAEIGAASEKSANKAHVLIQREDCTANRSELSVAPEQQLPSWDNADNPNRHYEEVVRATALWLFDYMRKTGAKGIMEAVSGGADSAFNSVMVAVMTHLALAELGARAFCEELGLSAIAQEAEDLEATKGMDAGAHFILEHILSGLYMGTNNSSDETEFAARFLFEGGNDPHSREIVDGIGGKFTKRNVQELLNIYGIIYAIEDVGEIDDDKKEGIFQDISAYLHLNPSTHDIAILNEKKKDIVARYPQLYDLVTAKDGVAYENIQARARQVLVMLFANKEGKMAVANPNLDEARNAYATFGGDLHSGTINLNAHMPKAYQLAVMQYLYEHGVQDVMPPLRALGPVLRNKPTAELQPKGEDGKVVQNDEDALQRSFAQMDFIARMLLRQLEKSADGLRRLSAMEVFEHCKTDALFQNCSADRIYNMVYLSCVRWAISQHKIHASPIGPTYGQNVDHQLSLRTPNFQDAYLSDLTKLGVDILFEWALGEGFAWSKTLHKALSVRAYQDEAFIKAFCAELWTNNAAQSYDLCSLYDRLKDDGWIKIFGDLPESSPLKALF